MLSCLPACMYVCMYKVFLSFPLLLFINQVWTEARVGAEWIHIDPCEAAVDEPLIYQGWGKNQTFIFAYKKESEKSPAPDEVSVVSNHYSSSELAKAGIILIIAYCIYR